MTTRRFYTGKGPDGKLVDTFPFPVTKEVIERGQERFNIYCAPCHDRLGNGDGMIVRRGYRHPPSYHIDRLRQVPNGYIFDVITNGFGAMPDYAAQIPPRDRWAIVAYIRALQLSQNASINDVPAGSPRRNSGGATMTAQAARFPAFPPSCRAICAAGARAPCASASRDCCLRHRASSSIAEPVLPLLSVVLYVCLGVTRRAAWPG